MRVTVRDFLRPEQGGIGDVPKGFRGDFLPHGAGVWVRVWVRMRFRVKLRVMFWVRVRVRVRVSVRVMVGVNSDRLCLG